MPPKPIFRQVALERLSSPEQLDLLMQVTTPKGWLGLIATIIIVVLMGVWSVWGSVSITLDGQGLMLKTDSIRHVRSLYEGQIQQLLVQEQQLITPGQVIAVIDTAPMTSAFSGWVAEIQANEGEVVSPGDPLFSLILERSRQDNLSVTVYLPAALAKQVMVGMEARISPATVRQEEFGFILGQVARVNEFPSTPEGMLRSLGNPRFVNRFNDIDAPIEIQIDLIPDPTTPSGYKWSSHAPNLTIANGTPCIVEIVLAHKRPLDFIIP